MNSDTTPTSITPHFSEDPSGLLPQEDWGKWVPRIEGNKRLKLPVQPARRSVLCYTCKQPTFVPEKALSALCTHCRSHLQLVDVLLSKSVPRSRVRTLGCLTVAADTQLSQVDFECDRIVIKGNVDGKIVCHNEMRISTPELRLTRPLRTQTLIIESGSSVYLSEGVHADRVIIHGELHGFIRAKVSISIESSGILHGDCNTPACALARAVDAITGAGIRIQNFNPTWISSSRARGSTRSRTSISPSRREKSSPSSVRAGAGRAR